MIKTETKSQALETIGEEISHELGAKMVKDYQDSHPNESKSYLIGRDILKQILNQPGCAAIRFYYAHDELGEKVMVYVGVGASGENIVEQTEVGINGKISTAPAIVADRGNRDTFNWTSSR